MRMKSNLLTQRALKGVCQRERKRESQRESDIAHPWELLSGNVQPSQEGDTSNICLSINEIEWMD